MADKKILEEEILSDEELDQVAGGSEHETKQLEDLYRSYCYSKGESSFLLSDGVIEVFLSNSGIKAEINHEVTQSCESWTSFATPNHYYLDGKSITHEQVVKHLKEFYKF